MTDVEELRRLSVGYAAAVDALDGTRFADLFTPDGELWVPDVRIGRDPTVCRSGRPALEAIPGGLARYHVTRHAVRQAEYAVDGDTATGVITGVAHHLSPDEPPDGSGTDTVWYLRYEDVYRRTAGGWRIARRTLCLRDVEERPVTHLGPGR